MRTIIIAIVLTMFFDFKTIAQKDIHSANFVISIDGRIISGAITQIKLIDSLNDGIKKNIKVDYYPGKLSLSKSDYLLLLGMDTKSITLSFIYTEYCNEIIKYNYEIDFKKGWLEDYFFVLYIFNTDKDKYKKIYDPILGKHYTYEYDYPGGQMRRVTKIMVNDCE